MKMWLQMTNAGILVILIFVDTSLVQFC